MGLFVGEEGEVPGPETGSGVGSNGEDTGVDADGLGVVPEGTVAAVGAAVDPESSVVLPSPRLTVISSVPPPSVSVVLVLKSESGDPVAIVVGVMTGGSVVVLLALICGGEVGPVGAVVAQTPSEGLCVGIALSDESAVGSNELSETGRVVVGASVFNS